MKKNMRKTVLAALACAALLLSTLMMVPQTVDAAGSRYSLTVRNSSSFHIYHMYMSSSDDNLWGPDQLGSDVLGSGQSITLTGIVPGEYDIKVVDEDGDGCVIRRVNVFRNSVWTLRNENLLRCEGY